ncbi:MAG: phosphatidylglycerophosphatase A [Rhodospirillaceae bacterium]|nr:phosphatidylglycerophosphatase A [Rhodospirillaceae bacterium]|tara:strand:- start:1730 stop:2224 length:495 start_codon:yes stop_codon:yes gene_type:complete
MKLSSRKVSLRQPSVFIATLGGVGWIRWAPGTWGSLFGLIVGWQLNGLFGNIILVVCCCGLFFAGVWACTRYSFLTRTKDSSDCVIDEFIGQLLIVCFIPQDIIFYVLAFIFFRFFDIFKLWPVGWIDKNVPGGLGIMLDDLAAALQTLVLLLGASHLFGTFIR